MVNWHVVVDWHLTKIYGVFPSKVMAEDWLMDQDITPDKYDDNEVSILPLFATTEKLEIIKS